MQEISTKNSDMWVEEGVIHKKIRQKNFDPEDIVNEYLAEKQLADDTFRVIIDARRGYRLSGSARDFALRVYRKYPAVAVVVRFSLLAGICNYLLKSRDVNNIRFFGSFLRATRWLQQTQTAPALTAEREYETASSSFSYKTT